MPNKLLMIGAAVGIAAAVLLLAVWAGGPSTEVDETPRVLPTEGEVFIGDHNAVGQMPIGPTGRFNYESWENGRLTRFGGERIVPRPQGVADVTDPTVQVQLGPGKELTITADQATVVAPDNHLREGEMRGNVIVTLYETPDGSPIDFGSDRDVVIRTYFDDPVQFDLQLQQLDSEGPIFMTGPQVEFRGRGLSLNYNQLRHRIERLVIEHGESLRYSPIPTVEKSPAPVSTRSSRSQRTAQSQPTPSADSTTQPDTATPTDADAIDTPKPARPLQFYFARFEELQDIQIGQGQYEIEGNELEAVFSAKAAREEREAPGSRSVSGPLSRVERDRVRAEVKGFSGQQGNSRESGPHPGPLPWGEGEDTKHLESLASADNIGAALAHALSVSLGQVPLSRDARSLTTHSDEDVVILWSGQLTVVPLSDMPEELAGPEDVMVTVIGSPASVRTDRGETILARKISFLDQDARLLAEGSDTFPVTVDSAELGLLTGRELSINQRLATGYVLGPGTLTGLIESNKTDAADGQPAQEAGPRRMKVAWEDRLDLTFYPKTPQDKADPDEDSRTGGAQIKGLKSARFAGGVNVDHPELDLESEYLTLDLAEDPPKGDDTLAVELLTATGNVKVAIKEQDARLTADRLLARPGIDQLELFGLPNAPAQVIRPDASLVGNHIVMDQTGGTVNVKGPGSIDFLQDINDPGKTVHVTWRDSMHYDDITGAARFVGDVKTRSTDGTDTNELMGDDLSMTFVPDESKAKDDTQDTAAGRRLATATMLGNVRFWARSYASDQREQLLTELYMNGPVMTFTDPGLTDVKPGSGGGGATQQVQVVGQGHMLITDLRPEDDADDAMVQPKQAGATPGAGAIDIAGRGKTAFQWSDGLVLDLTHGDMVMKGQVVMVHQPEKGDRVQLDCHDLAADLKAPSGKKKRDGGGWLSDDAPQPELDRVWADGGIRILHGPLTVHSDHLIYEESKREILLWADDRNQVTYEIEGEPNVTKSSAFKWHRDTGRFEVFRLRTGTVPLRRSERDKR